MRAQISDAFFKSLTPQEWKQIEGKVFIALESSEDEFSDSDSDGSSSVSSEVTSNLGHEIDNLLLGMNIRSFPSSHGKWYIDALDAVKILSPSVREQLGINIAHCLISLDTKAIAPALWQSLTSDEWYCLYNLAERIVPFTLPDNILEGLVTREELLNFFRSLPQEGRYEEASLFYSHSMLQALADINLRRNLSVNIGCHLRFWADSDLVQDLGPSFWCSLTLEEWQDFILQMHECLQLGNLYIPLDIISSLGDESARKSLIIALLAGPESIGIDADVLNELIDSDELSSDNTLVVDNRAIVNIQDLLENQVSLNNFGYHSSRGRLFNSALAPYKLNNLLNISIKSGHSVLKVNVAELISGYISSDINKLYEISRRSWEAIPISQQEEMRNFIARQIKSADFKPRADVLEDMPPVFFSAELVNAVVGETIEARNSIASKIMGATYPFKENFPPDLIMRIGGYIDENMSYVPSPSLLDGMPAEEFAKVHPHVKGFLSSFNP